MLGTEFDQAFIESAEAAVKALEWYEQFARERGYYGKNYEILADLKKRIALARRDIQCATN